MEISDIEYEEPDKFFIIPFRKREQFLEIFMNHILSTAISLSIFLISPWRVLPGPTS